MRTTLLLVSILSLNSLYSQTEKTGVKIGTDQISATPDENKSIEGQKTANKGDKFYKYIAERIVIPSDPNFVGGRVVIEFVVQTDGSLRVDKINNDLGFGISQQLRKIFENCKGWTPGIKDGKAVEVKYSMPLNIQGNQN